MSNNVTLSCRCSCYNCVLQQSLKYEKAQNYQKAVQIIDETIDHLNNTAKNLETAKQDLQIRLKSRNFKLESSQIAEKENFPGQLNRSTSMKKDRVAVAVFDKFEDPSVKAMYPKHLVYANGKDHQLEEIRAMMYRKELQTERIYCKNNAKSEMKVLSNVSTADNFTQTEKLESMENSTQTQRIVSIENFTQTDPISQSIEKISIQNEVSQDGTNVPAKSNNFSKTFVIDTSGPSSNSKADCENIKQHTSLSVRFFSDVSKNTESFTETNLHTEAFKIVPSSTPFHVNNKMNKETEQELSCVPKNDPNLSVILELSKERFSQTTSSGKNTAINSETRVISKNDHTYVAHRADGTDLDNVTNPFEDELIDYLLKKSDFPSNTHLSGYIQIDSDMPTIRALCSAKLGGDKYNICEEIGKGAYARIFKVHPENTPTKVQALKHQKPACLWEWYINKEIVHRLNDKNKEKFFIYYSKMYVFKNGSLMFSDWARCGTILKLVGTLKSPKNPMNRCPMSVCANIGIQLISSIKYLHSCQIIHGDVKPDNFVLVPNGSSALQVKLIDYGRSIDMKLFPPNKAFNYVVTTEDFTCNEMKERKPWSYQIDLFGLAATLYLLLMGEYMKTEKKSGVWVPKKSLSRYLRPDVWGPLLEALLNVPSHLNLPNMSNMVVKLEELLNEVDKYTAQQQLSNIINIMNKK